MPLPPLRPGAGQVIVQDTAFTTDVLGRLICNTWTEATQNGGAPFDVVVIGAGAYGAYCAAKIFRDHPHARILLLEAGGLTVTEHTQNIGKIGLNSPPPIPPAEDRGVRNFIWGLPWRGNTAFPGLAYTVGGKSTQWGGWCPRLTAADLARWPAPVRDYLRWNYTDVESEIGVLPGTDFLFGALRDVLRARVEAAAPGLPYADPAFGNRAVQEAPLAVQGSSPESGLFSFDKYSSVPILISAIRDDVDAHLDDRWRRLFLVPRCHVVRLRTYGNAVTAIEVDCGGRHVLPISANCRVVLAASAIESTRLALLSFPTALMGRNLMAHVRSDFTVRIARRALPPLPTLVVQSTALLVRGAAPTGRFRLQITASTGRGSSEALLFRLIPDLDQLGEHLANDDPDWLTLTVRAVGEMTSSRASWIDLSQERDEYGARRAWVNLQTSDADRTTWRAMEDSALELVRRIAGNPGDLQYRYDNQWRAAPFPLDRPDRPWRNAIGSTYHEAGTLRMGTDAGTSVTDPFGRFHHIANAYACDQSLFPTVGSVNPVLTGLTLAKRIAETILA